MRKHRLAPKTGTTKPGDNIGHLVVLRKGQIGRKRTTWICLCVCGVEKEIKATVLKKKKSCGCMQNVGRIKRPRTTLLATPHPLRSVYYKMRARCANPSEKQYADYGGRGIRVCERWVKSFAAFVSDMGPRPDGYTIERNDVNGPYAPDNCRWATRQEQSRNKRKHRRIQAFGLDLPLWDWARLTGVDGETIWARIVYYGWEHARAVKEFSPWGEAFSGAYD